MWKTALSWSLGASVALGLGVVGAQMFQPSNPPPEEKGFGDIPQTAEATDRGITWRVLGASFSGSETLLRMQVTVSDQATLEQELGTSQIDVLVPSPFGFEGPFAEGTATAGRNRAGDVLVHLPPLEVDGTYDGAVPVSLTLLQVRAGALSRELSGRWSLTLTGPAVDQVEKDLQVERLVADSLELSVGAVQAAGMRSTSETALTITLPNGVLMLTQPVLVVDGERLAAQSFSPDGRVVTVSFPSTPFGKPFEILLGAIATGDGPSTQTFTVDLDLARREAGAEGDSFEIPPGAVVEGEAELVLSGQSGTYGERDWVGLEISGNWHPEHGEPAAYDQDGARLDIAHVQIGYTKDLSGTVGPGTTNVAAFVDRLSDLKRLTIVMGAEAALIDGVPALEFRPDN